MNRLLLLLLVTTTTLTGCVVEPERPVYVAPAPGVVVEPIIEPAVVVGPYYGYHHHHHHWH